MAHNNEIQPLKTRTLRKLAKKQAKSENLENIGGLSCSDSFRKLWKKYSREECVYNEASKIYKSKDFYLFVIPLLTLQITNAILPVFLKVFAEKIDDTYFSNNSTVDLQETLPEGRLNIQIATTISAISAALIGIQLKLKYGEIGQKYANVASTYSLLSGSAFLHLTQSSVLHDGKHDFSMFNLCSLCGQPHDRKMHDLLLEFLDNCQGLEQNARTGVPLVPLTVRKKISIRMIKAELREEFEFC